MNNQTDNPNEEDVLRNAAEIVGGVYDKEYKKQQVHTAQCIMSMHLGLSFLPPAHVAIEWITGTKYDSATRFPPGFDPDYFEMVCVD